MSAKKKKVSDLYTCSFFLLKYTALYIHQTEVAVECSEGEGCSCSAWGAVGRWAAPRHAEQPTVGKEMKMFPSAWSAWGNCGISRAQRGL